jgi:hypothetical protein
MLEEAREVVDDGRVDELGGPKQKSRDVTRKDSSSAAGATKTNGVDVVILHRWGSGEDSRRESECFAGFGEGGSQFWAGGIQVGC